MEKPRPITFEVRVLRRISKGYTSYYVVIPSKIAESYGIKEAFEREGREVKLVCAIGKAKINDREVEAIVYFKP